MIIPVPGLYAAAFVGSLALSWGLTPLARRLARRTQALDQPSDSKSHTVPTPYLGGAAIVLAFAAVVLGAAAVAAPPSALVDLALVLGLAVALSLMGLIDDLRGGLHPWLRLGLQVGAATAVWAAGISVGFLPWEAVNAAVTILWIVGITNAFNLLDNMDGLAGGLATIAATAFFVIAAFNGQFLVAALAIATAGCALGFLRHNFHPATIYMGDAGSLFLGFVLAVLGILLTFDTANGATFLVPILVLGVAIFDTTLVTLCRIRYGRSPMRGGRDHTSHRLVTVGIPVPATAGLIYLAAGSLGWLAVVVARIEFATGLVLAGWLAVVAAVLGLLLARVPVYSNSRHRHYRLTNADLPPGLSAQDSQEINLEPTKPILGIAQHSNVSSSATYSQ